MSLSPFLFTMVMIIIMRDAIHDLPDADKHAYKKGSLLEILYADDTLLLGESAASVSRFMEVERVLSI